MIDVREHYSTYSSENNLNRLTDKRLFLFVPRFIHSFIRSNGYCPAKEVTEFSFCFLEYALAILIDLLPNLVKENCQFGYAKLEGTCLFTLFLFYGILKCPVYFILVAFLGQLLLETWGIIFFCVGSARSFATYHIIGKIRFCRFN